jgi:ribA/ribD-fused uncharacterized protein
MSTPDRTTGIPALLLRDLGFEVERVVQTSLQTRDDGSAIGPSATWTAEILLRDVHKSPDVDPQILATTSDGASTETRKAAAGMAGEAGPQNHGLDTDGRVCFYEQDFYVLSNFSAFALEWRGLLFMTSEAAYHWEKFPGDEAPHPGIRRDILSARSAHDAFKLAESARAVRRPDWERVRVDVMRDVLRAKVAQHEYVRRKLLATGERELVENSWRDAFWGWGPNRDGQNVLGRLWMEIRSEIRASRGGSRAP